MVNTSVPGPTMLMLLLMVSPPVTRLVMKPVTANVMTSPFWAVGSNVRNVPGPVFARLVTTRFAAGLDHGHASKLTAAKKNTVKQTRLTCDTKRSFFIG